MSAMQYLVYDIAAQSKHAASDIGVGRRELLTRLMANFVYEKILKYLAKCRDRFFY